jgi:hypothetical protein
MSITTPFSLELTRDEDAISIVEDVTTLSVPLKMKIFLGADVNPGQAQVYVGTLKSCFRHLMNESAKKGTIAVVTAYGDWQNASAGNITLANDGSGVLDTDVLISVAGGFAPDGKTHFYTETFDQLIEGLLERVKDN